MSSIPYCEGARTILPSVFRYPQNGKSLHTHSAVCIFKYMKIRKNITLSEDAERFLKELAKEMGKSQSEVIEELIVSKAEEKEKENKLRAFEDMLKSVRKMKLALGEEITFQKAKEMMGVEKYL